MANEAHFTYWHVYYTVNNFVAYVTSVFRHITYPELFKLLSYSSNIPRQGKNQKSTASRSEKNASVRTHARTD